MTITLITGANKGLGFESARRLIALGHTVWVGARDTTAGTAAATALGATFVHLDVTDDTSVDAAVATIRDRDGHIDVLINNAGIAGTRADPADVTAAAIREVYETNVFGVVRMIHAFLPLLELSENPVIVNVTSGLGSFTITTDPTRFESTFRSISYASSKSALTMISTQYARALPGIRVNAVDPGYTATDLNGHSGPQTVTEGTDAIVRLATIAADGPTGTFQDSAGTVPW